MIPKKRQATACLFYVLGPSAVFCHLLTTIGTIFVPPFDVLSENVLFYLRIKVAQERCGNCKFVYWDRAHALSTRKNYGLPATLKPFKTLQVNKRSVGTHLFLIG